MSRYVPEDCWRPAGVETLEPAANQVVRSTDNTLVVAGPGAGKTELLAQRANFLLTTGRCRTPHRILAVSFKRDAARNLKERVQKRCPDHANRFDSFTLDAFAKQLVDRFLAGLPPDWRPRASYTVRTQRLSSEEIEQWLANAPLPVGLTRPPFQTYSPNKRKRCLDRVMHGVPLPYSAPTLDERLRAFGLCWWQNELRRSADAPSLTFPMLNRLAAYLLRCNPKIVQALRETYRFVFLDEFQDTTAPQWDLLTTAFLDTEAVVTAVGDTKQRIMLWAGAKSDVFEDFTTQFQANQVELTRNYRSVSALVRIQHQIAQVLEDGATEPEAASGGDPEDADVCKILEFSSSKNEAEFVADMIAKEIASGAVPRDFCILARQKVAEITEPLQEALASRDIRCRDESILQDLRTEPLSDILLPALALGTRARDPHAWTALIHRLGNLIGLDDESSDAEIEQLATRHKDRVSELVAANRWADIPAAIVELVGAERYRAAYRQYTGGGYLEDVIDRWSKTLVETAHRLNEASTVVDDIIGVDVVPAMTIHKSKGLEFKTVIFIGLEDRQWWGFANQPEEERCAFFVAFSRAISSVVFTYSDVRGRRSQSRGDVGELHHVLSSAGVRTINCRPGADE